MGNIFCVEFQRFPLKFHTKYLTHSLNKRPHAGLLFNVECPREVNCYCAPGELNITSWPWNTVLKFNNHIVLFNIECPWRNSVLSLCPNGTQYNQRDMNYHHQFTSYSSMWNGPGASPLSLCPRRTQYHQLAMKYHHQWTGHCLMLSSPGEVNCCCAPGELSITTWPWNSITSGHHIV